MNWVCVISVINIGASLLDSWGCVISVVKEDTSLWVNWVNNCTRLPGYVFNNRFCFCKRSLKKLSGCNGYYYVMPKVNTKFVQILFLFLVSEKYRRYLRLTYISVLTIRLSCFWFALCKNVLFYCNLVRLFLLI